MQDRSDIVGEMTSAVDEAAVFFKSHIAAPTANGTWGPHEAIAHLLYWHKFALDVVRAGMHDVGPSRPPGTQDEINAIAPREQRSMSTEELVERLIETNRDLSAAYSQLPDPNVKVMIRGNGEIASAMQTLVNFTIHIRRHIAELG